MALGVTEGVSGSHISEHLLEQKVQAAALASTGHLDAGDILPSTIGLAVIALSSFTDKSMTMEERGADFGDRAAKATVAGVVAKGALIVTNTWWIGLIAGVGSRYLTTVGGNKRERYEVLKKAVLRLEAESAEPSHGHPIRRTGAVALAGQGKSAWKVRMI